jgi:hypothetical protein
MNARTRTVLAAAGASALVSLAAAACFPSYEFPGDDDGEGGVTVHTEAGGATPDATTADAGGGDDATTTGADGGDAGATHLDATTDGPPPPPPVDGSTPDGAVDAGLLADLVLLLHFEETSFAGAGAIKDSSGKGNHASQAGNPTGTQPVSSGKFGGAAFFVNGTGWLEIPDSPSLEPTTKLTLAAWVNYATALGSNVSPGIIVKRLGFGAASYTLFLWNNGGPVQSYVDIEEARLNSSAQVLTNAWYHLAAVYDGTVPSVTVYVNGTMSGVLTANVPPTLPASNLPVRIGDLPDGGNTLDNGRIDEVAIWSRALSAAEVMTLASATGPL